MIVWERLGQLSTSDSISVYCASCGNKASLDLRKLLIQYGARMRFNGIRRRLRCQRCGERRIEWRFTKINVHDKTLLVDLIEWKDKRRS